MSTHGAQSPPARSFDVITFDCYGTVIDWEAGITEAFRDAAAADRVSLDPAAALKALFEKEPEAQQLCNLDKLAGKDFAPSSKARNPSVHFPSRSQISTRWRAKNPSTASVSRRAACPMNAASGFRVEPTISTRRLLRSSTNSV